MKPPQTRGIIVFVLALLLGVLANHANALPMASVFTPQGSALLSPYWHAQIQSWGAMIVKEAERRSLDPDLVAAVMWLESRGDATAIGPGGSVGLMQIMPKEAGFSWRPTQQELLDPATNLFWGSRILATVIHQSHGDLFNALAAYNGGWEQVDNRRPRTYATLVMRDYAEAVAYRYGITERWIAFFAVQSPVIEGPIWVADVARGDVYFYGHENLTLEGAPLIPNRAPTTVVARCVDETTGATYTVGMWLYIVGQNHWLLGSSTPGIVTSAPLIPPSPSPTPLLLFPTSTPAVTATVTLTLSATVTLTPSATPTLTPSATATVEPSPSGTPEPSSEATPTPSPTPTPTPTATTSPMPTSTATALPTRTPTATPTGVVTPPPSPTAGAAANARAGDAGAELRPGPTLWWDVTDTLPPATPLRVLACATTAPDWVYVETLDGRLAGWTEKSSLKLQGDLRDVPEATPRPTMTASPTPGPTASPTATPTPRPAIACNGLPLFGEAWQVQKYNTPTGWSAVIFARGHEGTCLYTYAWNTPANVVGGPTSETVFFEVSSPHRAGNIAGSVIISDGVESVIVGIFIRPPDSGE